MNPTIFALTSAPSALSSSASQNAFLPSSAFCSCVHCQHKGSTTVNRESTFPTHVDMHLRIGFLPRKTEQVCVQLCWIS